MTDTPAPPPASVLAAAREAVDLEAQVESARLERPMAWVWASLERHARTHYGAIAAALLAAHEREAELRAEVDRWTASPRTRKI